MKRPPITFVKPSKGDLDYAALRLRYMNPENVAKDFPSKRERAAIAAVFEWLSYNCTTAWRLKNGTVTDVAMSKSVRREIGTSTHLVMSNETYERAREVLGASELRAERVRVKKAKPMRPRSDDAPTKEGVKDR